jgi:hypothetical protein
MTVLLVVYSIMLFGTFIETGAGKPHVRVCAGGAG